MLASDNVLRDDCLSHVSENEFFLFRNDSLQLFPVLNSTFDAIFANPPYFLSNGGISLQDGKGMYVVKGDWDKEHSSQEIDTFNRK